VTARVEAEPRAWEGDSKERIKRVTVKRVKVTAEKSELFFFIEGKNGFRGWVLRLFLHRWQRERERELKGLNSQNSKGTVKLFRVFVADFVVDIT